MAQQDIITRFLPFVLFRGVEILVFFIGKILDKSSPVLYTYLIGYVYPYCPIKGK